MPTGYTSDIYNGKDVSGKDFLMQCARAFGACIEMRDESFDTPIPEEFQPNTYYSEKVLSCKIELKKYQNMTIEEATYEVEKVYKDTIKYNKEARKRYSDMKNRYLNTLSEVLAWQPPTEEHKGLKEFAVQQLQDSIKNDCHDLDCWYPLTIDKEDPKEYIERQIQRCLKDIEYYSKEQEKENKRVTGRNKWIKELRDSIKSL